MIVKGDGYIVASANENTDYWGGDLFPQWASIRTLMYFPRQPVGHGPEPHYHDCDEFWMFVAGRGHLWLDGKEYEFTPGTVAYNPMGAVHEFHSYTEVETVAVTTPLERKKRPVHVHVDEDGPPEPTVQPFVASGDREHGSVQGQGDEVPSQRIARRQLRSGRRREGGGHLEERILARTERKGGANSGRTKRRTRRRRATRRHRPPPEGYLEEHQSDSARKTCSRAETRDAQRPHGRTGRRAEPGQGDKACDRCGRPGARQREREPDLFFPRITMHVSVTVMLPMSSFLALSLMSGTFPPSCGSGSPPRSTYPRSSSGPRRGRHETPRILWHLQGSRHR